MMNRPTLALLAATLLPQGALAGGFDRTGMGVGVIFEKGNLAEFSYARAMPTLRATPDVFGDIAHDYDMMSYSVKMDLDARFSLGLQVSQPFGLDVGFNLGGGEEGDFLIGGRLDSAAISAILRYRFNDHFGVHAGLYETSLAGTLQVDAPVSLGRAAGSGAILGLSAEVPKIAARLALTWFSGTQHSFGDGLGSFNTPPALNLDFQTGIAPDTLLFGQVRWGEWSRSRLEVIDIPVIRWRDNSYDYSLGIGRRFNENWSAAILWNLSPASANDRGFSLSPTNGSRSIGLAAIYTRDHWKLSVGMQRVTLGDNRTLEPAISWQDNSAIGAGLKIAYTF